MAIQEFAPGEYGTILLKILFGFLKAEQDSMSALPLDQRPERAQCDWSIDKVIVLAQHLDGDPGTGQVKGIVILRYRAPWKVVTEVRRLQIEAKLEADHGCLLYSDFRVKAL